MVKKRLRIILQQTLQVSVAIMLLCGLVSAQKARKQNSAEGYYKSGVAKMNSDNCEDAIKDFNQAVLLNPLDARFFFNRGECHFWLSMPEKALEDYNKAIELKPDYIEAYIRRGNLYGIHFYREESYAKATADFEKAIELEPNRAESYIARAEHFYLRPICPEINEGLADLDKAIQLNPRLFEPYLVRAEFFYIKSEYEKVIADSTTAIKLNPRNAYLFELRANSYFELEKFEQAIADYTRVLNFDPKNADILLKRAFAYREIDKVLKAEADERKARKLNSQKNTNIPIASVVGEGPKELTEKELKDSYYIASKTGEWNPYWKKLNDLTKEEIKKLTRICFAGISSGYGTNHLYAGELDEAIADYARAIKLNPQDFVSFNNRGIAYARKGDFDSATADFTEAINLNPRYKLIHYNRALALFDKGEFELSITDLTAFINYWEGVKAYQLRAKAYRKLGRITEAEADEKKIQSLIKKNDE